MISLKNYGSELLLVFAFLSWQKNLPKVPEMLSMNQTEDGTTNISNKSIQMGWTFSF